MKKHLFSILFYIACIGVFAGIVLHVKWLDYIFKPLIMISLGGFFLVSSGNFDNRFVKFASFAFLFSLFGDTFLMFTDKGMHFFIFGLSSFLLAQICYIVLFRHSVKLAGAKSYLVQMPFYLAGYIIYGVVLYSLMFNLLDTVMKIAVFVYMLALLTMSSMALNRRLIGNSASFLLVFIGSLLFVISDTLIALDKFMAPIANDRLLVMSTYIAAQFLITKGLLKQFE